MLEQTVQKVGEAEDKADEIIEKARIRAREIVDEAQKAGLKTTQSLLDKEAIVARDIVKKGEDKGKQEYAAILRTTQAECAAIVTMAEKNMDSAVDFIVGKVVNA